MKKILFVSVLIFCLLASTQTAYAYFEQESIRVLDEDGELYKITENLNESDKRLIPQGSILGANDTHLVTYTYQIYVEDGVNLESKVNNIMLGNDKNSTSHLTEIFNFDIKIDHLKDVEISNGMFTENTTGKLVEITIFVTMNDTENIKDIMTMYGDNLSFDYILTVSSS